MSKSKKIVLLICSHLLVAALCFGGFDYWFEYKARPVLAESNNMMHDMELINHYSMYASMQQAQGTPESYKEALELYSEALDYSKELQSPMFSESAYQTDKMLISVRLSELERDRGNIQAADNLLEKAKEHCSASQMKDCSLGKIMFIERITGENNIFSSN